MEKNNINIAEILKDSPKGMKLYSLLFGKVKFLTIYNDGIFSIEVRTDERREIARFTKEGLYHSNYSDAQCVLFPSSEMRDWRKFFKRGDVVIKNGGGMAAVFDGWANDTYTEFNTTINLYCDGNTGEEEACDTLLFRKATGEERKQFIEKAERAFNGKYNPETLQVEPVKLECPLKPFDKVLVRDVSYRNWRLGLFSNYEKDNTFPYVCVGGTFFKYCIPYNEHTAHLLGTTDPYTEGGSK